MAKILKVKFPKKCIGCEMCVFEVQRQFKKVGLEGALIRVIRKTDKESGTLAFHIELDPHVSQLNIESIRDICPTQVFSIETEEK